MNSAMQTARLAGRPEPGDDRDARRPVIVGTMDRAGRNHIERHHHWRGQLLHVTHGVMSAATDFGAWVVPPLQALWIPPSAEHAVVTEGQLALRSVYVHPEHCASMPAECRVVAVSNFFRELLKRLAGCQAGRPGAAATLRLEAVLLDELAALQGSPLDLPAPRHPRLAVLTAAMRADPADNRTLAEWGRVLGASERTLARAFVRETGLTFGAWRQRNRMQHAITRLHAGQSVTEVAYDLGYTSASAFVAMFRRTAGVPPGRYLRDGGTH